MTEGEKGRDGFEFPSRREARGMSDLSEGGESQRVATSRKSSDVVESANARYEQGRDE